MAKRKEKVNPLIVAANKLSKKRDADVVFYSGPIDRYKDTNLFDAYVNRKRKTNVILYLTTFGGDPDAAFRISRCLQDKYKKFTIIIPGFCKSAGTIIAIGADEIVLFDNGELGPLDVQIAKQDELFNRNSGANIQAAFDRLHELTLEKLEEYFMPLIKKSHGRVSTKTAIHISREIITGLYGHIFQQIDPMQIGEATRAMKIATQYGEMLNDKTKNLKEDALNTLAFGYPDHSFVIDRKEASRLFKKVRIPDDLENLIAKLLGGMVNVPEKEVRLVFLSDEPQNTPNQGGTNVRPRKRSSGAVRSNGKRPASEIRTLKTVNS